MSRAQQNLSPPIAHKQKTVKAKQQPPQAQQKIVPTAAQTESCESQTENCTSPAKPNQQMNRANSTKHFPCRHRSNKKQHAEAQKKTPKAEFNKKLRKPSAKPQQFTARGK
jgi:hypothetical protein